jgi:hypothetical protein
MGDELAVAVALSDLGHRLIPAAVEDNEAITHEVQVIDDSTGPQKWDTVLLSPAAVPATSQVSFAPGFDELSSNFEEGGDK